MVDAFSDATAVRFELRFTGTSAADPPAQTREARSLTGETGEQITKLRQFDLHLPFSAMRPLRKDIENQLRPIDDREVGDLFNGAQLRGSQILIEDEQIRSLLHGLHQHVFEFAASQLEPMMAALCALH